MVGWEWARELQCRRPNLINHHQNTRNGLHRQSKMCLFGFATPFLPLFAYDAAACLWICIESILYEHVWPRLSKLELGSAPQISLWNNDFPTAKEHAWMRVIQLHLHRVLAYLARLHERVHAEVFCLHIQALGPVDAFSHGDLLIATGGSSVQNANVCD